MKRLFNILVITLFLTSFVFPQDNNKKNVKPIPEEKSFITHHEGVFSGKKMRYQATAKETFLYTESGDPAASVWSVSYTLKDQNDSSKRPVTFVFHGGPGVASIWLHMGLFGPKVVKVDSDAQEDDGAAPYYMQTNVHSPLDLTDLVFVDPVGTGYSRVIGEGKTEDYWGLNEDAVSMAKFIRMWITDNNRWFSPKYIAGESYGSTRAVLIANELEKSGQNMALNGLILISQALDFAGSTPRHDNITSYITYLPSMAAVAWYHQKAGQGKELESFINECRQFTYNTYIPALYRGSQLSDRDKNDIAEELTYFTGLKKEYIVKSNLRILRSRFQKQLLYDEGFAVGRLDGRFMAEEVDELSETPHLGDPASYQISAAYTASLNHYFSSDLDIKMDRPYITKNSNVGKNWRYRNIPDGQNYEPAFVCVARKLADTMVRNTDMRIFVANGYYDLVTPFLDAEYTFARNGINFDNISMRYYEAGHMMYTHEPDMIKLSDDIRKFFKGIEN